MTTTEKLELITKDFLNRNGQNYTNARQEGRLDWEKALAPGESYSSRLSSVRTLSDLYKVAHGHARDMIIAMNCPFKVDVKLAPNGGSYTDSKVVVVATDYFDNEELSVGRKLDIFTGLAVHEACHLLYTDFGTWPKNRIIQSLTNVIEDERIEEKLGETKPGLVNFLSAVKYFYFGRHEKRVGGDLDDISRLFNAILAMIRYPNAIDIDDATEFIDALLEVRDILTPFPTSTTKAAYAAEEIYEVMKKYINEPQGQEGDDNGDESDQDSQSSGNDSKDGQGQGNQSNNQNQNGSEQGDNQENEQDGNGQNNSEQEGDQKNENTQEDNSQEDNSSAKGNSKSNAGQPQTRQPMSDKEIEKALEEILNSLDEECTEHHNNEQSEFVQDNSREVKAIQGDLEKGITGNVNVYYPEDNKVLYQKALRAVRPYIAPIASALRSNGQDRVQTIKGLKNGRLDTNKLVAARVGCDNIYTAKAISKADNIAVCVLIDESGSMDGEKIDAARKTAILLKEAVQSVPNVELFVYGHTTESCYAKINVYIEPGLKNGKYAIGSATADWSNLDGTAIRECAMRVRKKSNRKCLFFVISDGMPCEPIEKVINTVNDLSKQGFDFVNVGIDMDYNASQMYRNVIQMTDMARLAPELNKLIKKSVISQTKRR